MREITKKIISDIKKHSNFFRAEKEKKYHKSKREHFGVSYSRIQKTLDTYAGNLEAGELIILAKELWKTNIFECMLASTKILKNKKIKKDKSTWKNGIKFLRDCDGWALEDGLSLSLRECLINHPELLDEVEKWTENKNFWIRRAALVFTLPYAKEGKDPERMLKWAEKYTPDQEWFIQKAIGWWLRELSKHNPGRVIEFLNNNWRNLKTVARNEATRKMGEKHRGKINQQP